MYWLACIPVTVFTKKTKMKLVANYVLWLQNYKQILLFVAPALTIKDMLKWRQK